MNLMKLISHKFSHGLKLEIFRTNCQSTFDQRKCINENYRIRLAAAYRGLDQYGLNEGVCNHLSAKAPSTESEEEIMLIIPFGLHWKEVTPLSLIGVSKSNKVVEGSGEPELTALCIHRGIYNHLPHVKSIMHTHMPYATALTCLKEPYLRMVHQNSVRFYERISYDIMYGGLGETFEEGERLAKVLGNKQVLFMGSHGVLVAADTVDVASDLMYYLERAAMFQVLACCTNMAVKELDRNTIAKTSRQVWSTLPEYATAHLNSIIRQLQSSCSEFKCTDDFCAMQIYVENGEMAIDVKEIKVAQKPKNNR